MKLLKNVRLLGPIIVFSLAIICSVSLYFIRTEQYKDWQTTPGIVLDIKHYRGSGGGGKFHISSGPSHRIIYSYAINGNDYTGESIPYSGYDSDYLIGQSTLIWYDPDNPVDSSFHKPGPGIDPYAPFFLAVPISLMFLIKPKRRKNL